MRFIHNNNFSDPHINLAVEEFCLRNLDITEDCVLFYINAPSVIIGKHQNPFEECDLSYLQNKDIQLVRRISGGGAVYHDNGNLNFSFITGFEKEKLDYFQKLIQPIIGALHQLGVNAELTEKNNILVEGKKVSGNSQYTNINRMLSHGTLLFESDLSVLKTALKSNLGIMNSKAVQSARSEVVNISEFTKQAANIYRLRDKLVAAISAQFGGLSNYVLSGQDWEAIYRLAEVKYKSWNWTFGRAPDFDVRHAMQYEGDLIESILQVRGGVIKEISNRDKYRADVPSDDLKSKFLGQRYDRILRASRKKRGHS
jgi:lipoate-protein ligase A